jgi:hypothetical protein
MMNRDAAFRELSMLDIELTPLEERIYLWGRDNWRTLVALLDDNITEETIRDYMIENKCEDLPVSWAVNLISPSR